MIERNISFKDTSVLVGWVPLFHDMGLTGGILSALYTGAHCVFFSPMSFLRRPRLWLDALHKYEGTHAAGPNFGYEYVLRGLKDGENWNLAAARGIRWKINVLLVKTIGFYRPVAFVNFWAESRTSL